MQTCRAVNELNLEACESQVRYGDRRAMSRPLLKFSGGSASEETPPQEKQHQGDYQRDIDLEMPLAPQRVAKPRSDLRGHLLLLAEGARNQLSLEFVRAAA